MAKTSVATLQTIWECRWSRPGFRLSNVKESLQPENMWVCIRTGNRRGVTEAECERCPHWEFERHGEN
ncbi:MAG TPA: hypothetical protein VKB50_03170 [Vicinamibacterales bacterium]|nr:hypothetical protein [Vicinamibacterales bacterium]